MAQSLMTLILTGLLLLGQTLGIHTGGKPKTIDDLIGAFNDLRASFLEEPAQSNEAVTEDGADAEAEAEAETEANAKAFVIGQGESWETTYYVVDSGVDGPTVMVVGGLHGDEPAVVLAGDRLVQAAKEITSGKVILVPEANAEAIKAKKRLVGTDLNRAFPRGEDKTIESPLAREIWRIVEEQRPDWLIDLHDESSDVTGQTVVYHEAQGEASWAARAMAEFLSRELDDPDAAFATASGPVDGSLAKAAAERLDVRTLVLETHRRFTLTQRADWLLSGTTYLLTYLGMR